MDWARTREPLLSTMRFSQERQKVIAVIMAISEKKGLVHRSCNPRSFDARGVVSFIHELKFLLGPDYKFAIFWDNARIHRSKLVKAELAQDQLDIPMIFNCPYRPDLHGIERVWGDIKRRFRAEIGSRRVKGQPLNI